MRVISWNVQGAFPPYGSKKRIRNQIEFIESVADLPDLLMLNEVTTAQRELWRESLRELGYDEIVDTLDWAHKLGEFSVPPHQDFNHSNGNLTAVHEESRLQNLRRVNPSIEEEPWGNADLKDWSTNFPEKILNAEADLGKSTIESWNIRTVPGSMYGEEKLKILENTYNRIRKGGRDEERKQILAGDLNAPDEELPDGTVIPWRYEKEGELRDRWVDAELSILTGLEEFDMVDVFRHIHGYSDVEVNEVSFRTSGDAGKRFDHLFASLSLNPQDCRYLHEGFECSDHSPLLAEFDVGE